MSTGGQQMQCRHVWITTCRTCGTNKEDWLPIKHGGLSSEKRDEWVWWNKHGDGIAVGPRDTGCQAIVFTVEEAQAICQAVNKDSRSASSADGSAIEGTGGSTPYPNPPLAVKLIYNKTTKRIDKVRSGDGLVLESFEPPCDYYYEPKGVMGQRAAAIRHGDVVSGETQVNQGTFGSEKP